MCNVLVAVGEEVKAVRQKEFCLYGMVIVIFVTVQTQSKHPRLIIHLQPALQLLV